MLVLYGPFNVNTGVWTDGLVAIGCARRTVKCLTYAHMNRLLDRWRTSGRGRERERERAWRCFPAPSLSNITQICSLECRTCAMPNRKASQVSWWQGLWEPCHARSYWESSQWPSRNDPNGEWKFVQKRKGKPSRTSVNSDTPLDKTTAQARESHRTFHDVVLNGPVDQTPAKSETDEVLREVQATQEEILQSQLLKARAAAEALGEDPAFAKHVADLRSEIVRREKKIAGGKTAGRSSLAHRVEQKSLYIERENIGLAQLRKDMETVQAAHIAREADLADEKLELQTLKYELVDGGSGWRAMEIERGSDDEAKLKERDLELLRSFFCDSAKRMGAALWVTMMQIVRFWV